ncbi:tryptophan-rich protein [Plasmodium ovale]|uniref:Tryptophan-rich protein n=1 Tax=Plasmodium ovale TaxID=36330 RepID=A0A1D3JE28_PLAOA|nr:tryptophan-rich protein [Plasmodium ovale]
MEPSQNTADCLIKTLINPCSKNVVKSTSLIDFNGKLLYAYASIFLSIVALFYKQICSAISDRLGNLLPFANNKVIEWKKEEESEDEDEDEDNDIYFDAEEGEEYEKNSLEDENERELKENRHNIRKQIEKANTEEIEVEIPEDEEELEEWKNKEWKNFLDKMENEWQLLNLWMEGEKLKWIEGKDKELNKWKDQMETKWMNLDNIDKECECMIMENISRVDEKQMKEYLKKSVHQIINAQWKKWLLENESSLSAWLIKQWIQWKNTKILKWLMIDWKRKEDEFWTDWEKTQYMKWLQITKRNKWQIWKERVTREKDEWNNWIQMKEDRHIYSKWKKWSKWKLDRKSGINQWIESLTNKCMDNPKWDTWIKEKKIEFSEKQKLEKEKLEKEKLEKEKITKEQITTKKSKIKKKLLSISKRNKNNKLPSIIEEEEKVVHV